MNGLLFRPRPVYVGYGPPRPLLSPVPSLSEAIS